MAVLASLAIVIQGEPIAPRRRVCVIGAGAAGLESTKQLAQRINEFEPLVFEKNSDVGGLWIYDDSQDYDKHGLPVHSSVYQNLRCVAAAIPSFSRSTRAATFNYTLWLQDQLAQRLDGFPGLSALYG